MGDLSVQFDRNQQALFGPCACCGENTKRVWGYVYRGSNPLAAYFVEWTPGHAEHAASFDLIIGRWDQEADRNDRKAAALQYRVFDTGPSFMVIDAETRPIAASDLVCHALRREEVIGKPLSGDIFAMCDVIYLTDERIAELTHS